MICIRHFDNDCIKPATKTKSVTLKSGALPTIFDGRAIANSNSPIKSQHETVSNTVCSNSACNKLKNEYESLLKKYSDSTIQYETTIDTLRAQIHTLRISCAEKSIDIHNLDRKVKYANKSKDILKNTIKDLQMKNLLSSKVVEMIGKIDHNVLLHCLVNGIKSGENYPEPVRKFCFTIYYHSPAAYQIIRNQFDNNLPHPRTIKEWFKLSDFSGEHGIQIQTMDMLKKIADDCNDLIVCSLIFDEMYLRKQVYYDQHAKKYVGYITYPKNLADQMNHIESEPGNETISTVPEATIAKQAIVFMLSGLNKHFNFPVAYHFIEPKMNANERLLLVKDIICKVSECGIKISNLTFDGLIDNLTMCRALGADLDVTSPNFQPFFENPYDKSRIYIVLDPCHMEKLVRNTLGNKNVFYDDNDDQIKWSHFVELEKISRENGIFTHKLSKKHIEWKRNIMNVRVAVETFSETVANSMEMLRMENHPLFIDAAPTIRFSFNMDKIFNIFNSRFQTNQNIFKAALSKNNKGEVFSFLDECSSYFESLKIFKTVTQKGYQKEVKTQIINTRNKTAFIGFLIDIRSLKLMYMEYVEQHSLIKRISTYTVSQDHIEMIKCTTKPIGMIILDIDFT